MANSNNVFANAQPLQGNVSDWVAGQEKMDFDYRTEQREIAKIQDAKKEKEQLEYEKRLSKIKDFDIATTKVRSVDEINAQLLMKAKDKKLEIYKKLKPGISNEEYASLMIQDKKLDNLADYIKISNEAFVVEMTAFQDKVAKGEIQPTEKQLKMLHSLSEGYSSFELDDDMMPMIGLWDKDGVDGKGDGKPDILSYDKIISGQMLGELIPKVNFTTTFQGLGEKLGSTKIDTDRNFVEKTKKFTPIEFAQRTAKASLYDPSGNLTPIAKSWIYENKRISDWKNVPQAVLDEMEAKATRIMLDTKDTEDITKVDNSAINAAAERARKQAKDNKEKAGSGKSKDFSMSDLKQTAVIRDVTRDTKGNVVKKGEVKEQVYQGNIKIVRESGSAKERLRSFSVAKDGSLNVTVDVSEKDDNGNNRIVKKKYNSNKEADEVAFFVQRFKDPETGEYVKTIPEFVKKLGGFKENTTTNNNDPLGLGF
jgi:hypothetical protein